MLKRKHLKILLGFLLLLLLFTFTYFIPKAFKGEITIPPTFQFLGLELSFYGIIILLAIIAGFAYVALNIPEDLKKKADFEDGALFLIFPAIIGARLYHVLLTIKYYIDKPFEIIAIWNGGMGIFGATIGGAAGLFAYCRRKKISFLRATDLIAPALALGQAIGRWGNFINQEAFGYPTELPWKMHIEFYNRPPKYFQSEYFHPTFLYESLWCLLVFLILHFMNKLPQATFANVAYKLKFLRSPSKKSQVKPSGITTALYFILYSLGRFFIEFQRTDSQYIWKFRSAQVVSVVTLLVGVGLFIYKTKTHEQPTNQNN